MLSEKILILPTNSFAASTKSFVETTKIFLGHQRSCRFYINNPVSNTANLFSKPPQFENYKLKCIKNGTVKKAVNLKL